MIDRIHAEASRLHLLGYSWELALDLAKVMVDLEEIGIVAQPSEDVMRPANDNAGA